MSGHARTPSFSSRYPLGAKHEPTLEPSPPPDHDMTDHTDHSHDSDSDHDDRPNAPLPVWLAAGHGPHRATPALRAGHSLVAFSNRLYLFGGYCEYHSYIAAHPEDNDDLARGMRPGIGVHFNSLHEYSCDTGEWRVVHPGCHDYDTHLQGLPRPRRHASIVVHGKSLFVYGGFNVEGSVISDLWEYKLESNTWVRLHAQGASSNNDRYHNSQDNGTRKPPVPVGRAEHTAITFGNKMIVFGGYDGKRKLNDIYVFDFVTQMWSRPANAEHNAPSRRCKHSAVLYKKRMYITGGFQYKEGDNYALTDMHALDLDTYVWSSVLMGNTCPEALQGHKAVVCGDSMYVLGGKVRHRMRSNIPSNSHLPSTMQMSIPSREGNNSHSMSMSALPLQPMTMDLGYVARPGAPDNRSSGLNNVVFRYIFDANKWEILETSGHPPAPRQLHAAVALPTGGGRGSIFMFGGTDRSKQRFFNDLAELRGVRITSDAFLLPCQACSSYNILLNSNIFSDVRFVVEGRVIHAHRAILYARSEYFQHMFNSRMRESIQTEIPVPEVSYEVFRAILEYLYSGKVRVTHGKLAVDLLKAADMFRIEGLRNVCVEKVEQAVTVDNAAFVCQVADTHNAQHLKVFCITFMMQNFKEVIKSESFQTLMRQDPGGLGHEILEAYSDNTPYFSGSKRPRK